MQPVARKSRSQQSRTVIAETKPRRVGWIGGATLFVFNAETQRRKDAESIRVVKKGTKKGAGIELIVAGWVVFR